MGWRVSGQAVAWHATVCVCVRLCVWQRLMLPQAASHSISVVCRTCVPLLLLTASFCALLQSTLPAPKTLSLIMKVEMDRLNAHEQMVMKVASVLLVLQSVSQAGSWSDSQSVGQSVSQSVSQSG
jgi:hypothetical protein